MRTRSSQRRVDRRAVADVALVKGPPRVVLHDAHVLAADGVAAEVLVEDDLLLERHHVLAGVW